MAGSADVHTCVYIDRCMSSFMLQYRRVRQSLLKNSEDLFFSVVVLLFSYVNYAIVPSNHKILFPCYYLHESFNKIMYGSDTCVTLGLCCTFMSLKLFFLAPAPQLCMGAPRKCTQAFRVLVKYSSFPRAQAGCPSVVQFLLPSLGVLV